MAASKPSPTEAEVSRNEAARLIAVTPQRLEQHVRDGFIVRSGRGRYRICDVVHGRIKFLEAERDRAAAGSGDDLRRTKQQEIQQRIAIRDRSLINFDEAMAALEAICGLFLAAISGLPAQITREHGERTRIEGICDAVRGRLSTRFAEVMEAVRAGKPVGGAEPEEDRP
ncbi:MAG: hypothetical protein EOR96_00015 [Mesorhizobium sp.]|nr:MAG: hypothetical protein EOR96_00015 [Mesorhizobium sp.]